MTWHNDTPTHKQNHQNFITTSPRTSESRKATGCCSLHPSKGNSFPQTLSTFLKAYKGSLAPVPETQHKNTSEPNPKHITQGYKLPSNRISDIIILNIAGYCRQMQPQIINLAAKIAIADRYLKPHITHSNQKNKNHKKNHLECNNFWGSYDHNLRQQPPLSLLFDNLKPQWEPS